MDLTWKLLENTPTDLFVPRCHYVLHVDVAGEKGHNTIWNDGRHLKEKVSIVTDHSWKQK